MNLLLKMVQYTESFSLGFCEESEANRAGVTPPRCVIHSVLYNILYIGAAVSSVMLIVEISHR